MIDQQARFEAYWSSQLPDWLSALEPQLFLKTDEHEYMNEFARIAWGAWLEAAKEKQPAKKKGTHKKAHPWRKTEKPNSITGESDE